MGWLIPVAVTSIIFTLAVFISVAFVIHNVNKKSSVSELIKANTLLDKLDDRIYATDLEYNIIYCNRKAAKAYDLTVDKYRGKKCYEIFGSGVDRPCETCPLPEMLRYKESLPSCEWNRVVEDSGIMLQCKSQIMQFPDGTYVQLVLGREEMPDGEEETVSEIEEQMNLGREGTSNGEGETAVVIVEQENLGREGSSEGEGETADEIDEQMNLSSVSSASTTLSGKRILLVDDQEANRSMLRDILAPTGVIIDMAGDGQSAIDILDNSTIGYYDLIIINIQISGLDGYETTRRIRVLNREDVVNIPIIAITASTHEENVDYALASGMSAHAALPIDADDMLELLNGVLSYDVSAVNDF